MKNNYLIFSFIVFVFSQSAFAQQRLEIGELYIDLTCPKNSAQTPVQRLALTLNDEFFLVELDTVITQKKDNRLLLKSKKTSRTVEIGTFNPQNLKNQCSKNRKKALIPIHPHPDLHLAISTTTTPCEVWSNLSSAGYFFNLEVLFKLNHSLTLSTHVAALNGKTFDQKQKCEKIRKKTEENLKL